MDTLSSTTSAGQVIAVLRAHEQELRRAGIVRLSLFGSVARGESDLSSDVDIAVEFDRGARIGLFGLAALERRLAELVGRNVDLVAEPIEAPRLRTNIERDRLRAF